MISNARKKTILVVEDTPDHMALEKLILEQSGYKVLTLASGFMAIEEAKNKKPDLMILDVMLPDADGFEVCRKVKNSQETSSIPIIMVSVRSEKADLQKGIDMGANGYITKPFRLNDLVNKVKELLKE